MPLKINKVKFSNIKSEYMFNIFMSCTTTLSFIFHSAYLYGYMFFLFKMNSFYNIYLGFPELTRYNLCPVLPILEIYLHGVALTCILAFVMVFIMCLISFLSPTNKTFKNKYQANNRKVISNNKMTDQQSTDSYQPKTTTPSLR